MFNYVGTIVEKIKLKKIEVKVKDAVSQVVHSIKYPGSYTVMYNPFKHIYSLKSVNDTNTIENISGEEIVITGPEDLVNDALYDYGVTVYLVSVPALSDVPVRAAVLTFPGLVLQYNVNDVILLGEIEDKAPGGFFYMILGKVQKLEESEGTMTHSLERFAVDNADVRDGTVASKVRVISSNTDTDTIIANESDSTTLNTIWNNAVSAYATANTLRNSIYYNPTVQPGE